MRHILFLCVANSARSQMAEGIARSMAPRRMRFSSAGSAPTSIDPLAVESLAEIGIDIARQRSKGIADVPLDDVDMVVTLCADEVCPVLGADVRRVHWPLPDPAAGGGSRDARRRRFRAVRSRLQRHIGQLLGAH